MFFVSYFFAEDIFRFLVKPYADLVEGQADRRLIFTALHEAFFTYIKVAAFSALFFGFPIFASQLWLFVAPGLYRNEKGAFLPFLVATPILFTMGGAMVYYIVMPLAFRFFLSFESPGGDGALPLELEAKVDQYLSLAMRLIFAFGVSFELPVLMTLLARAVKISRRLVYSFLALIVLFFVSYFFAEEIFRFLVKPYADLVEGQAGRRRRRHSRTTGRT